MLPVAQIAPLIATYGYILLFPLAVLEGPIVTVVAGFLAAAGYLDPIWVYAVVVAGDLTGDCLYYAVGRWGRGRLLNHRGEFLGIASRRLLLFERRFVRHRRKTLVVGKLTHTIGAAVLVAAGAVRMAISEFLLFNLIPTVPKSLTFMLIGYYFGKASPQFDRYFTYASAALFVVGLLLMQRLLSGKSEPEEQRP